MRERTRSRIVVPPKRFTSSLLALVLVLVGITFAGDTRAATTARLVYLRGQGTESCPDEGELRDVVAARLGYDPFTPFSLDTLFAEVDREGTGFVARVKLVSHDNVVKGARTILTRGPCGDLIASLALTISLAIDPMAITRKGLPEGLPPGERPVEPIADPPAAAIIEPPLERPPVAPEPPGGQRVRFGGGGGLVASIGGAPAPAIGFVAFGRARLGDASLTLEGRADLPASGQADGPGSVSTSLLAASLLPCGHASAFFACARGTIGRLRAESLGVADPGSASALWAAVGLRAGLELPLGDVFALRLHGDADLLLTRYALRIGERTAFPYPPAAGAFGLAIAATIP